MNPGSSTLLERAGDNSQSVYIPMSPGPHHFDPLGYPSTALPLHRGPSRGSEIQPPPVNRNLKPDRKGKSTLSLSHLWTMARDCLHSLTNQVGPDLYLQGSGSLWGLTHPEVTHPHTQTLQIHPSGLAPYRLAAVGARWAEECRSQGRTDAGFLSATC